MIKFFDEENNQIESPFDEVVSLKRFSSLSFSIDDKKEIPVKDIFYLKLNSKNEYSLYLFFPKKNIDRDALLSRLDEHREAEYESNKEKAIALIKFVNEYKPIYSRYISRNEDFLNEQEVKPILPNVEFEIKIPEPALPPLTEKEFEANEEQEFKDKKDKKLKDYLVFDMKNIAKNKYHFMFLLISAFLFGFAAALGYCNVVLNKLIYLVFFLCAGAGVFLNTYCYYDYFAARSIKDRLFIYVILDNLICSGIAIGLTLIFHRINNGGIKEACPASKLAIITLIMELGMIIFSMVTGFLINFFIKRHKKSKEQQA